MPRRRLSIQPGYGDSPTGTPSKNRRLSAKFTPAFLSPGSEERSSVKRRLSRKKAARRKSMRLSLFPTADSNESRIDNEALSAMYAQAIKMSTENRINQRNTWTLGLIDHIDDILKTHTTESGVTNFQRASCTLDASVKIYSARVDDTLTTSFRVLENLSRTDGNRDDDELIGADEAVKKAARRGKSKRLGVTQTLVKNLNKISVQKFDLQFDVDPLFQRMSQAFDEGGAKGMLLSNLSVSNGLDLSFDSSELVDPALPVAPEPAEEEEEEEEDAVEESVAPPNPPSVTVEAPEVPHEEDMDVEAPVSGCVDIGGLHRRLATRLLKLAVVPPDVSKLRLCPALHALVSELEELQKTAGETRKSVDDESSSSDDDGGDGGGFEAAESDDGEMDLPPVQDDVAALSSDYLEESGGAMDDIMRVEEAVKISNSTVGGDYAFYNPAVLFQSVASKQVDDDEVQLDEIDGRGMFGHWAGPQHWKFAKRHAKPQKKKVSATVHAADSTDSEDEDEYAPTSKKGRKKKETLLLDFWSDPVDVETAFAEPPRAKASTQLSKTVLSKRLKTCDLLLLPMKDEDFTPKTFLQLQLAPENRLRVRLTDEGLKVHSTSVPVHSSQWTGHDIAPAVDYDDGPMPDGGNIFDDGGNDDDDFMDDGAPMGGRMLDDDMPAVGSNWAKPDHVVAKIDIKYAKRAKRVDVRKLKQTLWSEIVAEIPAVEEEEKVEAVMEAEEGKKKETSFQHLIRKLAPSLPADVSVPFYFICVLHLANEHNLELINVDSQTDDAEGISHLRDFMISESKNKSE